MGRHILIPLGLVALSLLVCLPPLTSAYDFGFGTPVTIESYEIRNRFKCWQSLTNEHWYCAYVKTSDKKLYIDELDQNFNSQGTDSTSGHDSSGFIDADCNYRSDDTYGESIECITREDDSNPWGEIWRFYFSNESLEVIDTEAGLVGGNSIWRPAVVNDFEDLTNNEALKSWFKTATATEPRYSVDNNINSFNGNGGVNLPASVEGYPEDMQLAYCNGYYYFLIQNTTTGYVYSASYDTDFNYDSSQTVWSDWPLDQWWFGSWVDNANDKLYFITYNGTYMGSGIPTIAIRSFDCSDIGGLTQVSNSIINQTDIEPTADSTHGMQRVYLTKDIDGVFKLFYEWSNAGAISLRVSSEGTDCDSCSAWMAQDECSLGNQKFSRFCPTGTTCTNTTYWEATTYCGIEYNHSQGIYTQGYTKYINISSCETDDWVKSGEGISTCSPEPLKIPNGCTNITVTEQITPIFQVPNNVGCEQGRFYMTTCTPSYNCDVGNYSCAQVNATQQTVYNSYSAGDIATGSSSLTVDNVCRCRWLAWDYGITSHRIQESLKVECDFACSNAWVCANDDYKTYRRIDCTQSNLTYCANGCDYSSGLCSGEDIGAGGSTKGNAVLWFLSPSPTGKIMMSLCGCVIIGALVLGITKSKEPILFIIGFGVGWVLFMFLGWIPAVLTIVLIAFVALGAYFKLNK
jgi:hypothetical protein